MRLLEAAIRSGGRLVGNCERRQRLRVLRLLCGKKNALSFFFLLVLALPGQAVAFEFSNNECEFKVNFPSRPTVKTIRQPLGNGIYSKTFIAKSGDPRAGRMLTAQCDNSMGLVRGLTTKQRQQMAEWSLNEWAKMIGLKGAQMFWEQHGEEMTLKMIGRRTLVEAGKRLRAAFQARMYIGNRSTMMVGVLEPANLSPSAEMYDFLDNSVSRTR